MYVVLLVKGERKWMLRTSPKRSPEMAREMARNVMVRMSLSLFADSIWNSVGEALGVVSG